MHEQIVSLLLHLLEMHLGLHGFPADIVEVLVGLVQLLHGLHVRSLREKLKCHI